MDLDTAYMLFYKANTIYDYIVSNCTNPDEMKEDIDELMTISVALNRFIKEVTFQSAQKANEMTLELIRNPKKLDEFYEDMKSIGDKNPLV